MKTYGVKDIFATLQGEGVRSGTKAVFIRFTGCNLWNGRAEDRNKGKGACAAWCDTDFFKGRSMTGADIIAAADMAWGHLALDVDKWCVLTGGEPCLQVDRELLLELQVHGWKVAVETNGSIQNDAVAQHADHVCVAPKIGADYSVLGRADEIKVVLPGLGYGAPSNLMEPWTDVELHSMELMFPEAALFVQPQDPLLETRTELSVLKHPKGRALDAARFQERLEIHISMCIAWVMAHSRWRLSAQLHKYMGLP